MGDKNHHRTDGPCDQPDEQADEATSDRGATLIEYVLMISLIALVCTVAIGYFQEETAASFSTSASSLAQAGM